MRKFLLTIQSYGRENITPDMYTYTTSSPSPSPSPSSLNDHFRNPSLYYLPPVPFIDSAFDFATVSFITLLLFLSLVSLFFVLHLRLKSRCSHHLRNFNSLWTVRVLLVLFVSYWALNEIIRLPFFRRRYLFPFLPTLSLSEQASLCKLQTLFSLGFLEPGFLITLLFLINVSIKQRNPGEFWSVSLVILMSLPTLCLQIIFVFFPPLASSLPLVMVRTSVLSVDSFGKESMMCTYPLLSSIVFGAFAVLYSAGLLLSCWRVVSLVINKNLRVRINILALTVMISLFIQTLLLGAASFWTPEDMAFGGLLLGIFVSVAVCAAVGEFILVIKPILEALAASGDSCPWNPAVRLNPAAESDSELVQDEGCQ